MDIYADMPILSPHFEEENDILIENNENINILTETPKKAGKVLNHFYHIGFQ